MHGPTRDDYIKFLLLSDPPRGLEALIKAYGPEVCGYLRKTFFWIGEHNLADVWQETLISVYKCVARGSFGSNGSLRSFVFTVAGRRAADWARRNGRLPTRRLGAQAIRLIRSQDETESQEVHDLVLAFFEKLPATLRLVLEADVRLFLSYGKWASLTELTTEVNQALANPNSKYKESDTPLTATAVNSRRHRAREQLREELNNRGYDV